VNRETIAVVVEDAQRCVEEVLFELVCTCNVKTLAIADNGVVVLPRKWAGKTLEETRAECGVCLEVVFEKGKTQPVSARWREVEKSVGVLLLSI